MAAYIAGFLLGLSLLVAIGAQNAFVLRQGLRGEHVFVICLICALSDAALIAAGVGGFGTLVTAMPAIARIMRYAGAAFLALYAIRSFRSAARSTGSLVPAEDKPSTVKSAVAACLAFTWLNPHVYLDTVVLVGSISTRYGALKPIFALGAMTASVLFFFSLGFGARLLRPLFANPRAWQILDGLIGVIMSLIAVSLVRS